jgi:DNA-binding MarR family transcriptional regulator
MTTPYFIPIWLAQSMMETEIAVELKVDQSTISRSIKVLKGILE